MNKFSAKLEIPQNMQDTINGCSIGLGGVGLIGGVIGPGADLVFVAPTWIGMTVVLADQAGHVMSEQTAKKVILAVIAGTGTFIGGTKIAANVIGWATSSFTLGVSLIISACTNAVLNSSFTYAYGRSAARYFLQTERIDEMEVMVSVLIALIGTDLGFSTKSNHLVL